MPSLLREFLDNKTVRRITNIRSIPLYLFTVLVLAITWSGVKTVQKNYELQKKIATLQQENTILGLQNANTILHNEYYKTDQFLELAARQQLGLAAPGETVLLVPEKTALRFIDSNVAPSTVTAKATDANQPEWKKNLETWRDFLFGHKLISD